MVQQVAWKVGGQQGEGIESTGEIFAKTLNRLGYHLYGYRHFSSRIKGGHTNNNIRISTTAVQAIADQVDILVAFDQESIDFCFDELRPGAMILAESAIQPHLPPGKDVILCPLPLTALATEAGAARMKNMVAVGASLSLLGISSELCQDVVREIFAAKGEAVVNSNLVALQSGETALRALFPEQHPDLRLPPGDGRKRLFMIGNEAAALGALAGGCRFMAAYPITPASDIMEYLTKKLPQFGGVMVQTEDEIAAVTMAIGANHAGVRAITASSGPGLALMTEAIGLAGMTETPLVVIDVQRAGPSTGMPTKEEQADLLAMLYAGPGEIPKIVIAPDSAEAAFYDAIEALNLAEEFQCPVILLSDLQLGMAQQTLPDLDYGRIQIRRGKLDLHPQLPEQIEPVPCKRFLLSDDGISPRFLPGVKNGIFHVTGLEHDEIGRPAEGAANRQAQTEKRLRKLDSLTFTDPVRIDQRHTTPDLLLVGWNATAGAINEARERLEADGITANCAQVRLLHPFPTPTLTPLLAAARQVIVIEQNATGQLAQLLRMNLPESAEKIVSLRKYDGNPFKPGEINSGIREVLHGHS
jgi:2-oxoglutarate ferredoxin oxidoreductase subunit alpha